MYKKLSFLLVLVLAGSCDRLPLESAAQSQPADTPPPLAAVRQAETVEIYNDWNGYSDITPILRHSKLRLDRQKLVGNSHIAVGGYGAAGIHQQKTTKVQIPTAVTAQFLATLAKTPLQVGTYQPRLDSSDNYPSIQIRVTIDRQQITFSSQSQADNYVPWKVTLQQHHRVTEYISNSAFPAQALKLLNPYLDRTGLEAIVQRRLRQKLQPPQFKNQTIGRKSRP
ncbi:hypothetical protein [Chamaesiphon sp. VAR_69_metabat_338]|uniref:hypothetical protein n=1 Tax=Chamaesiphon sp. VAR_69_metabat_338 TaxID=2964704 RepID=UPI00286DFD37|nr:hypothetical protein [Chamaesiphon sp. VAR_69_metabat_338]